MGGCFMGCFGGPKEGKKKKSFRRIPSKGRSKEIFSLPYFDQTPPIQKKEINLQIRAEEHLCVSNEQLCGPSDVFNPTLKQITERNSESFTRDELKPTPNRISDGKSELCVTDPLKTNLKRASDAETREEISRSPISSPKKKVTFDLNATTYVQISVDSSLEYEEHEEVTVKKSTTEDLPINHRYKNCTDEDDYIYEDDEDEDDDEEEDEQEENEEDESYDSYFSLQLDKEKKIECSEVNSGARDRKDYVFSVLNPVENLSQWKSVAGYRRNMKSPRKDNSSVKVDASLSNWLSPSDNQENTTPNNQDNQEQSQDGIRLMGSSAKGIPNTTRKYREDQRVNYHLTPFEVRLERTLNKGDAEAY